MEWKLEDKGSDYRVYTTSKEFNGDLYIITIWVDKSLKSDKFWIEEDLYNEYKKDKK